MDRLQHSRWRIARPFTILSGRTNSNDSTAVDSIERVVRLISPPARAGETEIELKLISVLKNEGAAAFPSWFIVSPRISMMRNWERSGSR